MFNRTTNDASAIVLAALAETLSDDRRATRFLDLTGLDPADLRSRAAAGDPAIMLATLDFLGAHGPDLVAVAEALGTAPAALVATRSAFEA